MVIFPVAPDQTIAQMWSNEARGGVLLYLLLNIISQKVLYHATDAQVDCKLSIIRNFKKFLQTTFKALKSEM